MINLNIKYILNCAKECKNLYEEDFIYKKIDLIVNIFFIKDKSDFKLINCLEEVFKFFEEVLKNNSKVFVHCQLGKSRSVALTIAYLMKFMKIKLDEAYTYVKRIRKIALPNLGFMNELREFEKKIQ